MGEGGEILNRFIVNILKNTIMKNITVALFLLLVSNLAFGQIEWAPVGAKWWQIVEAGFDLQKFITEYECLGQKDTLGHSCMVIHESSFDGIEQDFLSYQDGEQVFFYMGAIDGFVRIYDYAKQPGESYSFSLGSDTISCEIDSITWEAYGGNIVQVQHAVVNNPAVPFGSKYTKIYAGIGSTTGLGLPIPTDLTPEVWWWLSCYQPPNEAVYSINEFPGYSCQSLSTPIHDIFGNNVDFEIYPNPASGSATVNFKLPFAATIQILNGYGQKIQVHCLSGTAENFQIDELKPGLYFVTLFSNDQPIKTKKLLRL